MSLISAKYLESIEDKALLTALRAMKTLVDGLTEDGYLYGQVKLSPEMQEAKKLVMTPEDLAPLPTAPPGAESLPPLGEVL